jgi:hypothetical protein
VHAVSCDEIHAHDWPSLSGCYPVVGAYHRLPTDSMLTCSLSNEQLAAVVDHTRTASGAARQEGLGRPGAMASGSSIQQQGQQ